MAPPTPMHCSHASCDYVTPVNIPSYDLVLKALEIHNSSHLSQTRAVHEQVPKSEKPKRPVVTSAMSESDWTFFLHKWDRYVRQAKLSGQNLLDELWSCLDSEVERLAFNDGTNATDRCYFIVGNDKNTSCDDSPPLRSCCASSQHASRSAGTN